MRHSWIEVVKRDGKLIDILVVQRDTTGGVTTVIASQNPSAASGLLSTAGARRASPTSSSCFRPHTDTNQRFDNKLMSTRTSKSREPKTRQGPALVPCLPLVPRAPPPLKRTR